MDLFALFLCVWQVFFINLALILRLSIGLLLIQQAMAWVKVDFNNEMPLNIFVFKYRKIDLAIELVNSFGLFALV